MTKRTMERPRSFLLFRYWKILFGIVGLLDCSCYCYCYYYHRHHRNVGDSNSSGPQHRHHRHRRHSKKNRSKGDDTTNGSSFTSKQKQLHSQKNQIVSSFLWQSMAFSHHPDNDNNGIVSPAQTNNHNTNNTNSNSKSSNHDHNHNNGTRQGFGFFENTTTTAHKLLQFFLAIHLGFGFLCLVEMAVRAAEARRIVVEYQAIAALEHRIAETVAKVYRRRKLLQGRQQQRSTAAMAASGLSSSFYSLRKAATQAIAIPSSLTIITTATTIPATSSTATTRTSTKLNPYLPSLSSISDTTSSAAATTATSAAAATAHNTVHRCYHVIEDDADKNEAVKGKMNDTSSGDSNAHDDDEAMNKRNILLFLRATFRLWIPVGVTCFFWLALLPLGEYYRIVKILLFDLEGCDDDASGRVRTDSGCYCVDNGGGDWEVHTICHVDQNHLCYGALLSSSSPMIMTTATAQLLYLEILGDDASWATLWITTLLFRWTDAFSSIQDYLVKAVWTEYLWKKYLLAGGRGLQHRPKLVWKRVGRFLNFIKLIRFAGPLTRMVLKLSDQLVVGYSTFRKDRSAKTHRAHKLQRPSLLLRELKRIESFHKIETTIASWPSHCSMLLDTLTKEVGAPFCRVSSSTAKFYARDFLEQSHQRGRQITRQIRWLQEQLRRGLTDFSSSEVYDSILRLSKDISLRHLDDDGHSENDSNGNENDEDSNDKNDKNNNSSNNSQQSRNLPFCQ
uniref:Uncharacterized protein n=1 Tax=Pseudo-nitzschia australis TaxID=44445 RepID=A0A7S4AEX1_9STRA